MEEKTYVFGENGQNSNILSTLVPLLQNRGVDPSVIAMLNNNGGFGNNGGWWVWILFLALFGWGGNGFGGGFGNNGGAGFLSNQISNNEGRDLLMQAIQGNHDALNQLASTLQVNNTAVQNGFSNVMQSLCNIGNQVGLTAQQTVNAIQNGNMSLAQQVAQASSQNQLAICQQTNSLQSSICDAKSDIKNGLTMLGFQGERQTCAITNAIKDSTQTIVDGQKAQEIRELNALLSAKETQIAELRSAQSTRQIVDVALAPIYQQLQALAAGGTTVKAATT